MMQHTTTLNTQPRCRPSRPSRPQRLCNIRLFSSASSASSQESLVTCKRCLTRFLPSQNNQHACRHHTALFTGGELSKAIGFLREGDAKDQQLLAVKGKRGLLQFWDCCGAEDEKAPGCTVSYHITWDEDMNRRNGWSK